VLDSQVPSWQSWQLGVTQATGQLLSQKQWKLAIASALETLGHTTEVDRIDLWFLSGFNPGGTAALHHHCGWQVSGVPPWLPEVFDDFADGLGQQMASQLSLVFSGQRLTVRNQEVAGLGTVAVELLPVQMPQKHWGVLSFTRLHGQLQWTAVEHSLLAGFALHLGQVMQFRQRSAGLVRRSFAIANRQRQATKTFIQRQSESRLYQQNQVLVALSRRKHLHQGNFTLALQDITQAAVQTLDIERTGIWIYNSERTEIDCLNLYEQSSDRHSQGQKLLACQCPDYFKALEQARILAIHDAHTDSRTQEFAATYLLPLGITSMLDAPIWLRGQMVGVLCHEHIGRQRQWTVEEQQFAAALADFVSLAMESRDRTQAQAALQSSQERLSSFFHATFEAVVIHNQGQIIDVNQAAESLFGYTKAELINKSVLDLAAPEVRHIILQRLQVPSEELLEAIGLRKDGSTFFGEVSGKDIEYQGRPARVVGVRDITDRKRAEQERRLSAQRDALLGEIALRIRRSLDLQEILEQTVAEVRAFLKADRVFIGFICQAEGDRPQPQAKIMAESVDPQWQSCLDALIQDPPYLTALINLSQSGEVEMINDTHQASGLPINADALKAYQVRAGLAVPITLYQPQPEQTSNSTLNQPQQRYFGVLVAHQCSGPRQWQPFEVDLLEQLATQVAIAIQQAELYQQLAALNANLEHQVQERTAQLQQNMQELKELNQLKDVFLHAVSHDLRTPIMGTLLVLNNLLNSSAPTADASISSTASVPTDSPSPIQIPQAVIQRMIQSNNRQLALIDSLLEIHASDAQGIVLHRQPTELATLVKSIAEDLEPLLHKNQAVLNNYVTADLPLVEIDSTQLRRVYENLITNALKHNPLGLNLTLRATLQENKLLCTVQDNGIGISPEQSQHLFDLYFRGSGSRHLTGIGLGLYLCRQVINAHGGEIGVLSSSDTGATFWFTLPINLI
jgi:PAS domain S-box-containing protein